VETYVDKEAKMYVCRVSLPGVEPKDVHIQAQANVLTIRERKLTHSTKEIELLQGEVVYGSFERIFTLPEGVLDEKLNTEYLNGVLEITAPVAVAALPRKIEIRTAAPLIKQIAAYVAAKVTSRTNSPEPTWLRAVLFCKSIPPVRTGNWSRLADR
jgi:HSP20 family protein